MARISRFVVPGVAHHVTQRGNRRQPTFFREYDYELYRQLLAEHCEKARVSIWAYSLLPNHVHLIAIPKTADGLRTAFSVAHRRYTLRINRREGWQGCLWQGRFASFPMDERHLLAAARYVLLNPVRAGLAAEPGDWPYSSARAHLGQEEDALVDTGGLASRIADWKAFLADAPTWCERSRFRRHERSGLPLGEESFLDGIQTLTGKDPRPVAERSRRFTKFS